MHTIKKLEILIQDTNAQIQENQAICVQKQKYKSLQLEFSSKNANR